MSSEFGAERERNANQRRVWQGGPDGEVGPALAEPFDRCPPRNEQRVLVDGIDLGESFDEISRVALVAAESSPNRVGVNCYSQVACGSLDQRSGPGAGLLLTRR